MARGEVKKPIQAYGWFRGVGNGALFFCRPFFLLYFSYLQAMRKSNIIGCLAI
jgi:hypothetical protein